MLSTLSFLACWLPIATSASLNDVTGFIFNNGVTEQRELGAQLDVSDLRVLLDTSRRDRSSSLGHFDDARIWSLNQLNGGQSKILSCLGSNATTQMLITWDGISLDQFTTNVAPFSTYFEVKNGAASLDRSLIDDFSGLNDQNKATKACHYEFQTKEGQGVHLNFDSGDRECPSENDLATPDSPITLENLIRLVIPNISAEAQRALISIHSQDEGKINTQIIENVFSALHDLAVKSKQHIVLLCSPSTPYSNTSGKKQKRRFEPTEQRLSDIISPGKSKDGSSAQGFSKTNPKQISKSATTLPSTIMPLCYTSNSTCDEITQGCSGHGYCYRKSSSKNSVANKDCFACKCVKTVVSRYPDGRPKKTIQWGGPACQKKDVSTPFFIFTILTVLIGLAIVGGIRLLFNMGQEELPSVLSAGVAAKAQK